MGTLSLHPNLNLFFLFHPPSTHKNPNFFHQNPNFSPSSLSLKSSIFHCSKSNHIPAISQSTPTRIKRVSRATKIKAQRALLDYLLYTRNYAFPDAEFISKNSPHFIHYLISKINIQDGDVFRSLRRYLMYNPINEFEPFLESLGIKQRELQLFLPKGLFFLIDDSVLVDNFHVLYNHGVPRNRIGKIYKEAREVFRYGSGVLAKKFKNYEDLGLSKSSIVKLVICCPLLLVGDVDPEFVAVLDWLKKIGIESQWIVCCMSCIRKFSWKKMIDTIKFVHEVGYSEKQMYDLFKADPRLLLEGSGKKMYLFLGRLIKSGVDVNVVRSCFAEHPDLLSRKSVNNLIAVIAFLYNIRMEQDDMEHVLTNYMHILSKHSIKGHITVCKELRVGKADLCRIIKDDPLELISLASKLEQIRVGREHYYDPRNYLDKTTFLLKLNYIENSEEMEEAMEIFKGRGDRLQERFDCLVEAGLDYNSVVRMIRQDPRILNLKKTLLQKKLDFIKNTSGFPIECVVGYPYYFSRDLGRVSARFSMYQWLKKRNAIDPVKSFRNIVSINENNFVKYFVNMHPEGPTVWESIKSLSNKYWN
ncbi:transcription termination factor MTEF18, mitochondrial-like [Trifolium pratense]|uniref:transcription termination factor MTEF18, mitochondrial-like n=1 Tax=Trifolium pratense TaxID=57577 RepID=UPI000843EC82|nr:transcription termination factor MTEF18, mitochondrial-like [Trifolium pratense]